MTKLKLATLNARGLQSPGVWGRFLDAVTRWTRRHRVSVVVIQEHNLNPARDAELKRACVGMGMCLTIGYAPASANGVHHGGVLMLTFESEVTVESVTEAACDMVRVQLRHVDEKLDVAGVYVPSTPLQRVDMLSGLQQRLGESTIVGGDWNCVPDVTLDVTGGGALQYSNIGADKLASIMEELHLIDYRRLQLEHSHEHTRKATSAQVATRLDRWYVPDGDDHEGTLWNISVDDTLVWKDGPATDHLAVILTVEASVGEMGRERQTVRATLLTDPGIQGQVMTRVKEAYAMGGSPETQWARSTNMLRDLLLKETAAARKRDAPKIKELRMQLDVLRRMVNKKGPTEELMAARERAQTQLRRLEQPEAAIHTPAQAKEAADRSDKCTAAYFKSYKSQSQKQWINEMKHALSWKEGEEPTFQGSTSRPDQVAQEAKAYYQMLFADKAYSNRYQKRILRRMGRHQITRPSAEMLDQPISDKEVLKVMENLPTGKQAGPDRIPNEVYKYMSSFFAPKLATVLRRAQQSGTLPEDLLKGDIGLIHKKKARDEIRNYRPITLLQGAYKIFTRVLAKRMALVVHEFVSECQKGFVPHTFIGEASMLLNLIEAYVNDDLDNRKGIMIFCDMEKAFDRVSYDYLLRALKALGFGEGFIRTVGMMYNVEAPPQRRIYANGYYSEWFSIKSGVAQGCPLSPLLFLLVAQGLKISLEMEGVRGIKVGTVEHSLSQFADDTTILLASTTQIAPALEALRKWGLATCMRENADKREGLALGKYRTEDPDAFQRRAPQVVWKKEGEFLISLGVPTGNDLDHARWWKAKVKATRDLANRWVGLYRSSYYGRNLIVQAMYFGRLRYWLWSLPMTKAQMTAVQEDADRLWWSRDPILDDNKRRVRRFVARRTAIGPKALGGMGTMEWSDHVAAMGAKWILRYLDPSVAAWKQVLDALLFQDDKGNDVRGGGRAIVISNTTRYQKLKMLACLPKRATYIKNCLSAFWRLNITQSPEAEASPSAEGLWFNHSFPVAVGHHDRKYFVNTLGILRVADVIDYDTGRLITRERWKEWILQLHCDTHRTVPSESLIAEKEEKLYNIIAQIPQRYLEQVYEEQDNRGTYVPEAPGFVALTHSRDTTTEEIEDRYASVSKECDGTLLFTLQYVDAIGIPHDTDETTTPYQAIQRDWCFEEVAMWGDVSNARIAGKCSTTFPRATGWMIDGTQVDISRLGVKDITRFFTMRKFRPPTAEEGWNARLSCLIPWILVWKLRTKFATPRDLITHTKLLRRNLFTASRDPDSDGRCLCCGRLENQIHLAECPIIRREFWRHFFRLMCEVGFSTPLIWDELTAMLVTGALTDTTVMPREQYDILVIAWRCLYAELVHARVEKKPVKLQRAVIRAVNLLISRVQANGEFWLDWVNKRNYTSLVGHIAERYRKDEVLIDRDIMGDYGVHRALISFRDELTGQVTPAAWTPSPRSNFTPPTQRLPSQPRMQPPPPQAAQPAQPMAFHQGPNLGILDDVHADWRDMSGDARTSVEAQSLSPPQHAECNLAVARNILRDEGLHRSFLRDRQVGRDANTDPDDTRWPDWQAILQLLLRPGEVAVQFPLRRVDSTHYADARLLVMATINPPHVTCAWRLGDTASFRYYDNDSAARQQGFFAARRADQLPQHGVGHAITTRSSGLWAAHEHRSSSGAASLVDLDSDPD